MTGNSKRKTLTLLGLIILFTIMVAANLPQLELQPGMPLPRLEQGQLVTAPTGEESFISISMAKFIFVSIALILIGATLYSAYQMLRGADWKLVVDFLRYGLIISVIIGCLVFLILLFPNSGEYTSPIVIPTSIPSPVVTAPLGSTPPSLLWLVGIGLLVITILVLRWVLTPSNQANPIDLVGIEAEKARQAIITGMDLKDVIINCYRQMSMALKQEQGIERKEFMTTGEFENLLQSVGMPPEPIHQLTRLFDAVRYGNWQPNAADEQMAIQSLVAIMVYSRNIQRRN